jgi:aryl-alcohol dehydrogenase-like predicted oxidoreductase
MDTTKNRVGLGTFPLADVFSHVTPEEAEDLVKQFIDLGGYYIDTAPMYGFGEIEKLLGKALSNYPREKYYLVTKCGYIDVEGKTFQTIKKSGKYDDVIRECENSLKRLKTDYIDLYFMHSPDPNVPIEETLSAMEKLQVDGKIKEIGVSNVNLSELKEYNKTRKIKYVQNRFSLINQSIDSELQKYMTENNIKLVPYQVIDRGQLTETVLKGADRLVGSDLRIGRSDWLPEKVKVIQDWTQDMLLPIAEKLGISLVQLSVAWALHQPFMGFVIVGNTNPKYTSINLNANEVKLDDSILKEIVTAYQKLESEIKEKYNLSIREFRGLNEKYY